MVRPHPDHFWGPIFARQEPEVWRGAARDLAIVELARGGPESLLGELVTRAGSRPVHATAVPPSAEGRMGFHPLRWRDWSSRESTLGAFADDLLAELTSATGHCLYMQSARVGDDLPELAALTRHPLSDDARMQDAETQLWIGSGGQRVAIHQDFSHSIAVMVSGAKEFTLYPPDELPNLYTAPRQALGGEPWRSPVDCRDPDLARYPRFARAMRRAQTIRVEAGDMLFIPAYWWHSVDSFDFNVMFNLRWHDVSAEQRADVTAALGHALVTARTANGTGATQLARQLRQHVFERTRPPSDAERAAWVRALGEPIAAAAAPDLDEVPLRLHPDARVTFGAAVATIHTPRRGSCTLPWEWLPMLACFEQGCLASEALERLSAEFDFDPDKYFARLHALVDAGVVVAEVDAASRDATEAEIRAAVAHAGLSLTSLPPCHGRAFRAVLETFGFDQPGSVYAHLPAGDHGLLGAPMRPGARTELMRMAADNIRTRHGSKMLPREFWHTRYEVAAGRTCELAPGGLSYQAPGAEHPPSLPWGQLELLAHFAESSTPASAYAAAREDWTTSRAAFEELVGSWVVAGILIAATSRHPAQSSGIPLSSRDAKARRGAGRGSGDLRPGLPPETRQPLRGRRRRRESV
ncbi:MAG: cupin-like domain-containing protein [Myxococcota bacterium]